MKGTNLFHNLRLTFFLLAVGLSLCVSVNAQKTNTKTTAKKAEIVFDESGWKAVLQKAKTLGKYIFVDAYATWCGPCKELKNTTFKNKAAATFFNDNFINVSMDMEKGEGIALSEQWRIDAYPTLIIFNPAGAPVLQQVGFIKAADLLKFGQQAIRK